MIPERIPVQDSASIPVIPTSAIAAAATTGASRRPDAAAETSAGAEKNDGLYRYGGKLS